MQVATDDQIWDETCMKYGDYEFIDGYGCSKPAYENLTSFVSPFLTDGQPGDL